MKPFQYYSLAAAAATAGVDAKWRLNNVGTFSSQAPISDGKEFVMPVYVQYYDTKYNPTSIAPGFTQADKYKTPDANFFWILKSAIEKLESVHFSKGDLIDAPNDPLDNTPVWNFEAHYRGRDTSYFKHTSDEAMKGGNLILSTTGVDYFWEGDELACQAIKILGAGSKDTQASNKCTFFEAREYCHRHGGELLLPDEYFWEFIINPMCKTEHVVGMDANILKTGLTSGVRYWLNMQKVYEDSTLKSGNIRTTAAVHLHGLFGTNNQYTGINKNLQIVGISNTDHTGAARPSSYNFFEYLVGRDSTNYQTLVNVAVDDFKLEGNHERIGKWDANSRLKDPNTQVPRNQFNYALKVNDLKNTNQIFDNNLSFISRQLKAGGSQSQACTAFACQKKESATVATTDLQDFACDHNNIRPLCMTKEFLRPARACPANMGFAAGVKPHCGDNVNEVLMETVWNQIAQGVVAWGEPEGAQSLYDLSNDIPSLGGNSVMINQNYVTVVNQIISARVSDYLKATNVVAANADAPTIAAAVDQWLKDENKKKFVLYTNCMGTFDPAKNKWEMTDRATITICETFGFQYICAEDFDTNAASFGFPSNANTSPVQSTECTGQNGERWYVRNTLRRVAGTTCDANANTKACQTKCECTECSAMEPTHADQNLVKADVPILPAFVDDGLKPIIENKEIKYSCPAGFHMQSAKYASQIKKDPDGECELHSLKIRCEDDKATTTDAQYEPFWTTGRTEANSNTERAFWVLETDGTTRGPKLASQEALDLTCVAVPCPVGCPKPADIPHGTPKWLGRDAAINSVPIARGELGGNEWDARIDIDKNPRLHDWVSYECDADYELRYTDDDSVASIAGCARQCYIPRNDCGNVAKPNWADDASTYPILDPLNCYCAPKLCNKPDDTTPGAQHKFFTEKETADEIKAFTYYPVSGFNTLDVECKAANALASAPSETLTCNLGWTSPSSTCKNHACPDPRAKVGTYWAKSANVAHTCASLDQAHLGGENDAWVPKADASIIFADVDTFANWPFTLEGEFSGTKIKEQQTATMLNGSKYRFTCKKGFSPYMNADNLMKFGRTTPSASQSFDCVCNNGQWVCNEYCRCDGFCDKFAQDYNTLVKNIKDTTL